MRLTALLVALLVLLGAAPAQAQTAAPQVVVIGVAGLRWDDVTARTPVLRALAARSALGVLSVKALPAVSCRGDGWLTLGAGTRAEHVGGGDDPCDARLPDDLGRQRALNLEARDGAVVGALREALLDAPTGEPVAADGPGARVALGFDPDDGFDEAVPAPLVRLVDAGTLTEVDRPASLAVVDMQVGRVLETVPPDADVLLVGLSAGAGASTAALHVAMAAGPSYERGALRSASTRRAPYVQLIDVAPTVLDLLGEPVPDVMDGQPWTASGEPPSLAALRDLDDRAVTAKATTVPFFVTYLAVILALLLLLRRRPRPLALAAVGATAVPGASYLAMLVPWWRSPLPLVSLLAVTGALAVAAALLLRRPGPVLLLTAAVLTADLLAGAPLQVDSPAGYSPLVAGRFAGLGNVAFGVWAAAWLLGTALVLGRRARLWQVALLGAVAVLVLGVRGIDVGGVLALLPAFVVLALRLTGRRVSLLRLAAAGLSAAALVTALALVDLARPAADRTHLGRFAADVRDGTAGEVLARKADAVLGLLFANPVTALLPVVVAAAVWLVLRPPPALRAALTAVPALRDGLAAVGVAALLGFVLNDSGAAVPATALLLAAPATVAVSARVAAPPEGAPL